MRAAVPTELLVNAVSSAGQIIRALPAMTAPSVAAKKAAPDTDEIMITSPQGRAAGRRPWRSGLGVSLMSDDVDLDASQETRRPNVSAYAYQSGEGNQFEIHI